MYDSSIITPNSPTEHHGTFSLHTAVVLLNTTLLFYRCALLLLGGGGGGDDTAAQWETVGYITLMPLELG